MKLRDIEGVQLDPKDWEIYGEQNYNVDKRVGYPYLSHRTKNRIELLHREIMQPGPNLHVDHINGDRMDNRRANLRITTRSGNLHNTRSLGVVRTSGGRWTTKICRDWKQTYLGTFDTFDEARAVYLAAKEKQIQGEIDGL